LGVGKRLSNLKPGESGIIHSFDDEVLSLKLMEMGCLPGSKVTYNFSAPLGDPICISVAGYDLSLRLSEASCITIE